VARVLLVEVERQQVHHIIVRTPAWQLSQDMEQVSIRLDVASAASEHQAIDDRACIGAGDRSLILREPIDSRRASAQDFTAYAINENRDGANG